MWLPETTRSCSPLSPGEGEPGILRSEGKSTPNRSWWNTCIHSSLEKQQEWASPKWASGHRPSGGWGWGWGQSGQLGDTGKGRAGPLSKEPSTGSPLPGAFLQGGSASRKGTSGSHLRAGNTLGWPFPGSRFQGTFLRGGRTSREGGTSWVEAFPGWRRAVPTSGSLLGWGRCTSGVHTCGGCMGWEDRCMQAVANEVEGTCWADTRKTLAGAGMPTVGGEAHQSHPCPVQLNRPWMETPVHASTHACNQTWQRLGTSGARGPAPGW